MDDQAIGLWNKSWHGTLTGEIKQKTVLALILRT